MRGAIPFSPDRWPPRLRLSLYGLAVAVLLYLCLAPTTVLPKESISDKAEHALAWAVLAGAGLAFWPARPGRVLAFALAFGAAIEVLQATLPFGRDGEWRDLLADAAGVTAAVLCWLVARAVLRLLRWEPAPG